MSHASRMVLLGVGGGPSGPPPVFEAYTDVGGTEYTDVGGTDYTQVGIIAGVGLFLTELLSRVDWDGIIAGLF